MMDRRTSKREAWLADLSTRELVIYLLELGHSGETEPELSAEIEDARKALRAELASREWPVPAVS